MRLRAEPLAIDISTIAAAEVYDGIAAIARNQDGVSITHCRVIQYDMIVCSFADFDLMPADKVFKLFAGRQHPYQPRAVVTVYLFEYVA